jgi:hypothetical protein
MINFLVRHWRGELPLAQALWLNGVALTVIITGFINLSLFGRWQSTVDSLPAYVTLVVCAILFLFIIPLWQMRGLWRTADHHIDHVGTILAGRGAQTVATVLTLLAVVRVFGAIGDIALLTPAALNTGIYRAQIEVRPGGREIRVLGGFGFGLADRVADILVKHPAIRRVRLESWGGSATEATLLAELIERYRLNTYTGRFCANTCVVPFIFGRHRTLQRRGRLAFSGAYGLPQSAIEQIRQRGVGQNFLRRWEQFGPRTWYPSERELRLGGVVDTMLGNPGR